jgi:hypothetical protein
MRVPNSRKTQRRQLNQSIAKAAHELVRLVRAQIDARGSSLIARIAIDDRFVGVSFVDYPDEFLGLVEWRRR